MLHFDFDLETIALNTISLTVILANWVSENLNTVGGFMVMMSVVLLNIAKAYNVLKHGKKRDHEKKY